MVLDVNVAGFGTFVARDASRDLGHSLNHVRDEMIRQLNDAKTKSEPRNNRHLRKTTRH